MSSVPHPAGLPDVFVDRSLGRLKVPTGLRAAGLRLTTLSESYGIPADEDVADTDWLALAGSNGWAVLMKDTRVRYNTAEREAVVAHDVRCFCLSRQDLTAGAMVARFLDNLPAIVAACQANAGPFIYAVQSNRLDRLL